MPDPHTAGVADDAAPSMKYAVLERERRFLTARAADLPTASRVLEIEDRYVTGTRLRLRTVREPDRGLVRKLGQKARFAAADSSALVHTTMYLDEDEYALLAVLPATTLGKTRHIVPLTDELDAAVDVFRGALAGLRIAEVDLGSDGGLPKPLPAWLGVEITDVEAFTGHALAGLDAARLVGLMAAHGCQDAIT